MNNKKEKRCLDVEFKANENENEEMIIEGYAIVFNSPATHYYTEVISDRALDNTDMSDVVLRYNHNDTFLVLARTRNNSLELIKDSVGLKIKAKLIDTQANRDVYKCIKEGLIDKMSFAFTIREDKYDYESDTRTILDIDKLFDVAVVDVPFYDATSVHARGIDTSNDYLEVRDNLRKSFEQKKEINALKGQILKKIN